MHNKRTSNYCYILNSLVNRAYIIRMLTITQHSCKAFGLSVQYIYIFLYHVFVYNLNSNMIFFFFHFDFVSVVKRNTVQRTRIHVILKLNTYIHTPWQSWKTRRSSTEFGHPSRNLQHGLGVMAPHRGPSVDRPSVVFGQRGWAPWSWEARGARGPRGAQPPAQCTALGAPRPYPSPSSACFTTTTTRRSSTVPKVRTLTPPTPPTPSKSKYDNAIYMCNSV